jgi:hypothetical protein
VTGDVIVAVVRHRERRETLRRLGVTCPKCKKNSPSDMAHSCPFATEIHCDPDPDHCYCCPSCVDACSDDI